MKKINLVFIITAVFILAAAGQASAQDNIYLEELQKAGEGADIVFDNYIGPHKIIDSIAEIRGIGSYLASGINEGETEFSYHGKYRIIHAVDPDTAEGFDADIFIIEPEAAVDHIDNLRRMISGYLEAFYGYSGKNADTLAFFITVYNAVHRQDNEYFSANYKSVVTDKLSDDKTGLSLSYRDWPGKSMLVIPLTPAAGTGVLGDLASDVLTEDAVIGVMKSEDGMGLDERKDMVDLKEQEIAEERAKIEEEKQAIEAQKQEISEKQAELQQEADALKDDSSAEAVERKDDIAREQQSLDEEAEKLAEDEQAVQDKEDTVAAREETVIAEREEIAADQNQQIAKENEDKQAEAAAAEKKDSGAAAGAAVENGIVFLKLSGSGADVTGQPVRISTATGLVLKESELKTIRGRHMFAEKDSIYAIAGESGANRVVSIVRIDPETLELLESGQAEVHPDSYLLKSSDGFYAVVNYNSGWRIGRFDFSLKLNSVSEETVFTSTYILETGESILAQDNRGKVLVIAKKELSEAE